MRFFRLIGVSLLLLTLSSHLLAQDDAETEAVSTLHAMLQYVPLSSQPLESLVGFADIETSIATRPGAPNLNNIAMALMAGQFGTDAVWRAALPTTLPEFYQALFQAEEMVEITGFDIFGFRQTLYFGYPPEQGIILFGNFDVDEIAAKMPEIGFSVESVSPFLLLCSEDGCNEGLRTDLMNRQMANPFGGRLGQRQPIVVWPDRLLASTSFPVVNRMLDAADGDVPSLLDAPPYAAIANHFAENGDPLRQLLYIPATELILGDPVRLIIGEDGAMPEVTPEVDMPDLPLYLLATIAETANINASEQYAHLLLVYASATQAERAVEALQARWDADLMSLAMRRSIPEMFEQLGAGEPTLTIHEDTATGAHIVRMTWTAPLVRGRSENEFGMLMQSGLQFRLLYQMILNRDTALFSPSAN